MRVSQVQLVPNLIRGVHSSSSLSWGPRALGCWSIIRPSSSPPLFPFNEREIVTCFSLIQGFELHAFTNKTNGNVLKEENEQIVFFFFFFNPSRHNQNMIQIRPIAIERLQQVIKKKTNSNYGQIDRKNCKYLLSMLQLRPDATKNSKKIKQIQTNIKLQVLTLHLFPLSKTQITRTFKNTYFKDKQKTQLHIQLACCIRGDHAQVLVGMEIKIDRFFGSIED